MLSILPKAIVFIGSAVMALGILQPLLLVQGYVIFRPLIQPFAWLQHKLFGLPIAVPFSVIVILAGLVYPLMRRNWSLSVDRSGFFVAYLFVAFASAGLSVDFGQSLGALIKLLTIWFLYVTAYNAVKDRDDALKVVDAILLCSIVPMLFGFYQEATGRYDIIYEAPVDRVSSVFATGNTYGIFLSFVTAAAVIRLFHVRSRKGYLVVVGLLGLILVSQVLALNRGTWLALTAGFAVAAWRYRRHLNFKWLGIGALVFLLAFSGKIVNRFAELEDPNAPEYKKTNTLEVRLALWEALGTLVLERPVIGHGIGTNRLVSERFFGHRAAPHNDYLTVLLEMGVLGLIAYVAFLARTLLYFLARSPQSEIWQWNFSLLMVTVYLIVISSVQNIVNGIMNFPLFMILLAVVFKLNRVYGRRRAVAVSPFRSSGESGLLAGGR